MSPEFAALRSHRAVVISVVVAAVAVTAFALVGIAALLGWVPGRLAGNSPSNIAPPGNPVVGTAADVALAPGETLVAPAGNPAAPAPLMPHYSSPASPPPAPASRTVPEDSATEARPAPVAKPQPKAASARPQPSQASPPSACAHCGRVVSITTYPDMAEVRVRFEDGTSRTLRSDVPAPWRIGDPVRLEHGRLARN